MIIYNVTINIDKDIHEEWLDWMRKEHIPEVMDTGHFTTFKICKILGDEETGINYAIQYTAYNMEQYELYRDNFSGVLQKKVTDKFPGKFVAFRTLLEVL
ncbi:MAG: DUF4286 family protein [Bacteroidia bacterium]|nr:DUF4286 family protein [Bacteroidia bacterium]MCZ2247674.1 DUF4286 family protein [Bacteroidia bacterium]